MLNLMIGQGQNNSTTQTLIDLKDIYSQILTWRKYEFQIDLWSIIQRGNIFAGMWLILTQCTYKQ